MPAFQPISQSAAPAPQGATVPPQGQEGAPPNTDEAPLAFDIHINAAPSEIEDAVNLLKEAGMDNFAEALEKALQPKMAPDQNDPDQLASELEAQGSSAHGSMGA